MKTPEQREAAFRKDLEKLLRKYNAEMEITDDYKAYGQQRGIVVISIASNWDDAGNLTEAYTEFTL